MDEVTPYQIFDGLSLLAHGFDGSLFYFKLSV